jgi:uncharacterized protein YebE (UPF0316 family)
VITPETLLGAVAILGIRILNNTIGTLGIIFVVREQRLLAAIETFVETLLWVVVVTNVIKDLNNWLNLLAYCGGFALGNYIGLMLEGRLITSYVQATMTTKNGGHELAGKLREAGYGVTESLGEGRDGPVTLLHSVCTRRKLPALLQAIQDIDPQVFVSIEELRALQHGWIKGISSEEGGD